MTKSEYSGFLKESLPIAHTTKKTHKMAMNQVSEEWGAWKKSATRKHSPNTYR